MLTYLTFDDVSVIADGTPIVEHISFSLHEKKIITLLGPNGAGKSTIAKLALGLLSPTTGQIMRAHSLTIGYVPQKIFIDPTLPLTVSRFMKLKKNINEQIITEHLKQVNATSLLNKTMQKLSGGEMQRVLLAQALLNKPQLLVLDEPAQGVDMSGQIILYDLIDHIRKQFNCAILIISHDLHLVMAKTDEVICINKHICCAGTPANVSQDPIFSQMFGITPSQKLAFYQHHHDHQHHIDGKCIN